jgi:CHAT domain-containing protein
VIGTLWDVKDSSARMLFRLLHAALLGGAPPARALQQAQLEMLRGDNPAYRAPSEWSGIVAFGGQ